MSNFHAVYRLPPPGLGLYYPALTPARTVMSVMLCIVMWGLSSDMTDFSHNSNNILYSSQREIKAVVRSGKEEHNYLSNSKS